MYYIRDMIICSCNKVTKTEIEGAIRECLHDDPWQMVTPDMVYEILTREGKCFGCFPAVNDIIIATTQAYHYELKTPVEKIHSFIETLGKLQYNHPHHQKLYAS